jgi:threonine aldolase
MHSSSPLIDFRSDTFTQPDAAMRQAILKADVGDDVFEEDPTLKALESQIAQLFNREAALFLPSGTMANLVAIALHCRRGEEVVLEKRTHSFTYETGGMSGLLGVMPSLVDDPAGYLTASTLEPAIRGDNVHWPRTKLAIVENTANLAGGLPLPLDELRKMKTLCMKHDVKLHMDGARVWNAAQAGFGTLPQIAATVDTLSCCLSKGLGCPVGSLLVGDKKAILEARRHRKMLGGGMRQAGILAAAGLYALEHRLPLIGQDHAMAQAVAKAFEEIYAGEISVETPATNVIRLYTRNQEHTNKLVQQWDQLGIKAFALGEKMIRLVTHFDLPKDTVALLHERLKHA